MSRQLPPRPSLEFLKKAAKDRLVALQRVEPGAKLADALHAIAREYGFTNWASLKAHVGAAPVQGESPLSGTWKVREHAAGGPATIHVAVDGDTVTITDVVLEDGRERRGTNTLTTDGQDHQYAQGYVVAATWAGSHVLEAIGKRDGRIVGRVTYQVSIDDRTMTIASDTPAHDGYPAANRVVVFDRA